jgi:hypothetical protein
MTANAEARLAEARDNVWLGEVAALEESLTHLRRLARRPNPGALTRSCDRRVQLRAPSNFGSNAPRRPASLHAG